MTRAWAAAACLALAACPGKKQPEDQPAPPTTTTTTTDAAVAKPVVVIDAGPLDLATLPVFPGAAPDGAVIVHAADADLAALQHLLARGANHVSLTPPSHVITGTIGPTTGAAALAAIGGGIRPLPRGKGIDVDLDFRDVTAETLLRFVADIDRRNIVLAVADPLPTLDVWTKRGPTGAVLAGALSALGLEADEVGGITWVRRPGGPALDPRLLAQKQPNQVDLDVAGARAGAVYALLVDLGVMEAGAPCDAGPPITARLKKVSAGAAIATVASLSGIAPRPGEACASTVTIAEDTQLQGVARVGATRAALAAKDGGIGVVREGGHVKEIGDAMVVLDVGGNGSITWTLTLVPSQPMTRDVPLGRLAATVIDGDRSAAVFENSDGAWEVVVAGPKARIEPGKVTIDQRVLVLASR